VRARAGWILSLVIVVGVVACGDENDLPLDFEDAVTTSLDPRTPDPLVPAPPYSERRRDRDLLFHEAALTQEPPAPWPGWFRHDLLRDELLEAMQTGSPWSPAVVRAKDGGVRLLFDFSPDLPMGFCLPVGRTEGGVRLIMRMTVLNSLAWNAAIRFVLCQSLNPIRREPEFPPGYPSLRFQFVLGGGGDGRQGGYLHGAGVAWCGVAVGTNVLEDKGWQPGRSYLWDLVVAPDANGWYVAGKATDALDGTVILESKRHGIAAGSQPDDRPWSLQLLPRGDAPCVDVVIDGLWLDTAKPLQPTPDAIPADAAWGRNSRWARGAFLPEDDGVVGVARQESFDDLGRLLWARLRFDGDAAQTRAAARRFFASLTSAMVQESQLIAALRKRGEPSEHRVRRKARLVSWVNHIFPQLRRRVLESPSWRDAVLAKDLIRLAGYLPPFKPGVTCDPYDLRDLARALQPR